MDASGGIWLRRASFHALPWANGWSRAGEFQEPNATNIGNSDVFYRLAARGGR
jgi:hypothetical protein